jgi:hypothetical protein
MLPAAAALCKLVTSKGTLTLKYQKRNKAYGLCVYFESGSGVAKTWLSKRSFDDRLEELLTAFPDIHAEDINDVFRRGIAPRTTCAPNDQSLP